MHVTSHEVVHQHTHATSFRSRLLRNCILELKKSVLALRFLIVSIFGIILFTLGLSGVKLVLGRITPYLAIYGVGTYLTLLPSYVVIPLIFVPIKFSAPILALCSLFSFFIVFLQ